MAPRLTIATPWLAESGSQRLSDSPMRGSFLLNIQKPRLVGESFFRLRISPQIRSQNWNGSTCSVRDLCQTDLCKNLGKSASLPCPFKRIRTWTLVIKHFAMVHSQADLSWPDSPVLTIWLIWKTFLNVFSLFPGQPCTHGQGKRHYMVLWSHCTSTSKTWYSCTADTIQKIWNKCSQKWNCTASVLISTFMCLWTIYIIPPSGSQFCSRKICGIYKNRSQTNECGN